MLRPITKEGYGLLGAIKGSESPDYNTIFGGSKFTSYSDHPRVMVDIPWNDKQSSAAGAYQITKTTYDEYKGKFGISGFSPAEQDDFAWKLAQTRYSSITGKDLQTTLESGDVLGAAHVLSPTWTSLPGGSESNSATAGFKQRYEEGIKCGASLYCYGGKFGNGVQNIFRQAFGQPEVAYEDTAQGVATIKEREWFDKAALRYGAGIFGIGLIYIGLIKIRG